MNRLLSTLSLPPATLSALTRAGYDTIEDIASMTAEDLARGKGAIVTRLQ